LICLTKLHGSCAPASIEARTSYYYPTNQLFRDIYGEGTLSGIELTFKTIKPVYLFASGNIFYARGNSINPLAPGNRTTIWLVPLELGLMAKFPVHRLVEVYFGSAIVPFYVHTKNDSPFVIRKRDKWDVGGSFKTGVRIHPVQLFFLDVFLNYYLMEAKFNNTSLTIGRRASFSGLSAGGGIGFSF